MTFAEKLREEAYYARQEGLEEGLEQGRREGRKKGREEGREAILRMLLDQGMINEEQVARILEEAEGTNKTEE